MVEQLYKLTPFCSGIALNMKFGINLIYVLLLMAGRLIWLLALREMGRRLSCSLSDMYMVFRFHFVFGICTPPFLFHRLIYSFLLCPKTTGGYGHLHPVPDERTFQSDFYTVQLQYFHLLLQALLRLPLLFPQKAPG